MENTKLKKNHLSMLETIAMSVAIMAPTASMALNVSLMAGVSSYSVTLVFIISMIVVGFVSLSIIKFNRHFSTAGSLYTFTEKSLGKRTGFISGWSLLLTYLMFTAGCTAALGSFAKSFLNTAFGINIGWLPIALVCSVIIGLVSYMDVKISTRVMLVFEGISIVLILILAVVIFFKVSKTTGLSTLPFKSNGNNMSAIATASVFGFLSFAGFEGASSLGEETKNPKKFIPIAIGSAVIITGLFFLLSSYVQVIGFGANEAGIKTLAKSSLPLSDLSLKYISSSYALMLTLGAILSFFSCALGSASAGARMLFSMSRDGRINEKLATVHHKYNTPYVGLAIITIFAIVVEIALYKKSGTEVFGYCATIASLALIISYLLTSIGAMVYFTKNKMWGIKNLIVPIISIAALVFVLYSNIYPIPEFPANIFPFIIAGWIVIGMVITYKFEISHENKSVVGTVSEKIG
ncbi:APC family permease [Clostridium arbusti]|uniref:APC family permease n=1 Tax=Clostridium arbusti TaxID=1137848 RepID=UPI000287EA00|nr:APC family permease [Clostridium arbusti]